MAEVLRALEIRAPADEVWTTIADFAAVESYSPRVARCELEGADGPGQLRHLTLQDGTLTTSRLISIDPAERSMRYAILVTALPLADYTSTIRVDALTDTRCNVTWASRFEPSGASLEEASAFLTGSLAAGLEELRKLHER